jgi:hypothetical protein
LIGVQSRSALIIIGWPIKIFVVEGAWSSSSAHGWMDRTLGQKLRDLNKELKKWNKEVCGELEREINLLVDCVATLDLERKCMELSAEKLEEKRTKSSHVWTLP